MSGGMGKGSGVPVVAYPDWVEEKLTPEEIAELETRMAARRSPRRRNRRGGYDELDMATAVGFGGLLF